MSHFLPPSLRLLLELEDGGGGSSDGGEGRTTRVLGLHGDRLSSVALGSEGRDRRGGNESKNDLHGVLFGLEARRVAERMG